MKRKEVRVESEGEEEKEVVREGSEGEKMSKMGVVGRGGRGRKEVRVGGEEKEEEEGGVRGTSEGEK
ncbi:hypothetical protein Pcinc_020421 [Petrolisthes cinctipes]|uniref:Uncharacterized protein n=1 Tax=Petrolisthes cinctipes TaxID=88211 RepID=A0AAE1FJ67_PETCI|nr:hypothetical protein Pcinc_020421 [Petrolisthes cinctipes]